MTIRDLTKTQTRKLIIRMGKKLREFNKSHHPKDVKATYMHAYDAGVKATLEICFPVTPTLWNSDAGSTEDSALAVYPPTCQSPVLGVKAFVARNVKEAATATKERKDS